MTNTELLLNLIEAYKTAPCEYLLEAIAELVDNDYETLEPIMRKHGVTY